MKWNNVQDIVDDSLCMGCGICEPVCPVPDCIRIGVSPENGQLVPIVNQDICCERCDVCLRICPGDEVAFDRLNEKYNGAKAERTDVGVVRSAVVCHAADETLRFQSSSGGAATAMLVYLLDQGFIDGAIVARMSDERPAEAEVVVARTRDDILAAKGSKYCPVASGVGIAEVMRTPGRYAFVGLSCHAHAVRKFQDVYRKFAERIVVVLGLFCGGGITMNGTRFMLGQIGVEEKELVKLTIRGEGFPGKTVAVRKDGTRAELNKRAGAKSVREAAVYTSWMHRYFFPERCLTCTDVTAQLADISFGDPWLKRIMPTAGAGLSLVVARSAIGQRFLELAIQDGAVTLVDEVSPQEVADSQGKLKQKTKLRRYRIAARWLGLKTPEYGGLYEEGEGGLFAVLGAVWEYMRLRLGRMRRLWPLLLRLELASQHLTLWRSRWKVRLRRLPAKMLRAVGLKSKAVVSQSTEAEPVRQTP